ncbi:hypothetical protein COCCADRAFT_24693 [Bipolaris zeicola 26-R-13]|uniref:Uncharacterized protein n=1 Tax=Cochliobolus carbonum (strain 26-R-13) TaxID=930089 RepID=W6YCM4_COCC2|nr:uncharacterized protein COCCADRAFT_24693 [Bipolaris zeicola 26-R-13]EUC35408.1 hypothetical protein COCCADRAFT_24693 [Bipolaris zeicola 26-R-13]
MTKVIRLACNVLPVFALIGKISAKHDESGLFEPFPDWRIEYRSLLHPPLGETPAIWLAAQSLLVELMGAFETKDYGLWPDMTPVGKLPGEGAGGYLAALLLPEDDVRFFYSHRQNSSLSYPARVCVDILETSMEMKKVPQTSDALAFGSSYIFGNGFVTGFSKSVCKVLNPDMVKTMKKKAKKKSKKKTKIDHQNLNAALNAGFNKLTNALFLGLGTDVTDTALFVSQLETRLRYIDRSQNLERTYGRLLSDFTSQQTQFTSIAAHQPNASKSLREFNKLSCNALSRLPHRDIKINLAQWHETENATAMVGMFAEMSIKTLELATPIGGSIQVAAQSAIMTMTNVLQKFGTVPYSFLDGRSFENSEPRVQLMKRKKDVPVTIYESTSLLPPVSSTSSYSEPQIASHPSTKIENTTLETAIANSSASQPSRTATTTPQDEKLKPTTTVPTTFAKRPPFFFNFWQSHPILDKDFTPTIIATRSPPGEVMPTPFDAARVVPGMRRPGVITDKSIPILTAVPTILRSTPTMEIVAKIETATVTTTRPRLIRDMLHCLIV